MTPIRPLHGLLFFTGLLASSGCTAATETEGEGDEIGSVEQAIGGAACASGTPNATMAGQSGGTTYLNTGVTYTNATCAKWFLLRVPDLQQRVDQFDIMYDLSIDWSDRRSRTQEECVGAEIAVQIYG